MTTRATGKLKQKICLERSEVHVIAGGGGGTRSIHDGRVLEVHMTGGGGSDVFLGLKIYTLGSFFGSRDWSHIFLGLKKMCVCVFD